MGDVGFDGGEYREGFGADNLVDLNGGGDFGFDDFPSDSVADGLVGAGDLSSGFPGAADGPVAARRPRRNRRVGAVRTRPWL